MRGFDYSVANLKRKNKGFQKNLFTEMHNDEITSFEDCSKSNREVERILKPSHNVVSIFFRFKNSCMIGRAQK